MFLVALLATVPAGELGFVKLGGSNCHGSCVGSIGSVGLSWSSLVCLVPVTVLLVSVVI
jgi:hypothetical protein